ncbi:class I SAM-dependent methyltransferase [Paenibacillus aurantius]|uniref:Class I SAM-dependent methyltransferase n=1 Tax=Paenibacillus aurantius TaxID=2918900 RepID=A0AA96LDY0_9BACL|nr:class I SAM-dependent methyltransferase [Paenibacillus aurantius]WNQ10355.1 class I SAM-dependent methyltransferase [Paenibacillus aurantius]
MGFLSVLSFAHKLVSERMRPGEPAVDATTGNGVDTLFLARLSGPKGCVYGFDVQEQALSNTRQRLAAEPEGQAPVHLFKLSHARLAEVIPDEHAGRLAAVMFNLGYLPGSGDERIITRPDSTLPALNGALSLLRPGGIVTVLLYPGHEGGAEECREVERWAAALPQEEWQAVSYRFLNRAETSPYAMAVVRK